MERWCIVEPSGRQLPDPIGDSREDVIRCYEALCEQPWEWFEDQGYTAHEITTTH